MIRQIWPTTVAYFTALLTLLHTFIEDFRYGLRSIKRCKGVAAGVVISMGLGIGATASLFSFVDFFALRPLPVPETNQVVRLANFTTANSLEGFSYPEYREYGTLSHLLRCVFCFPFSPTVNPQIVL